MLTKATHREHCNIWTATSTSTRTAPTSRTTICDDWKPLGDPGAAGRLTERALRCRRGQAAPSPPSSRPSRRERRSGRRRAPAGSSSRRTRTPRTRPRSSSTGSTTRRRLTPPPRIRRRSTSTRRTRTTPGSRTAASTRRRRRTPGPRVRGPVRAGRLDVHVARRHRRRARSATSRPTSIAVTDGHDRRRHGLRRGHERAVTALGGGRQGPARTSSSPTSCYVPSQKDLIYAGTHGQGVWTLQVQVDDRLRRTRDEGPPAGGPSSFRRRVIARRIAADITPRCRRKRLEQAENPALDTGVGAATSMRRPCRRVSAVSPASSSSPPLALVAAACGGSRERLRLDPPARLRRPARDQRLPDDDRAPSRRRSRTSTCSWSRRATATT